MGALCVVASLGASVAIASAVERTGSYSFITLSISQSFDALIAAIMAPAGGPISPPTPRVKPKPSHKERPAPGPRVVAQCGPATILSALASDGETPVYRAIFAPGMIDDMVAKGCGQFYQGCNICSVRYEGCTPMEKAGCKTSTCLEKTCERKVICSSKTCRAQGREPNCRARMARTQCRKSMF